MQRQTTVLKEILKLMPRWQFERMAERHGADYRVRTLSSWSQFLALVYAQLAGATSLREVTAALSSHRSALYHLGVAKGVKRSTLADANAKRPSALFAEVFHLLLGKLQGNRAAGEARDLVRLIDSTSVRLSQKLSGWAHFNARAHAGVKLHVVYDPAAELPTYFAITPARRNDIVAAHDMPILAGATYVYDLAYYDFAWWAEIDAAGCRFVTRLKGNTRPRLIEEREVPPAEAAPQDGAAAILGDRIVRLARYTKRGKNPYTKPIREIVIKLESGRKLRLATNDLNSPARTIADLYKTRWQIELFFKWIKQNLKIKRFLGTSENAVTLQIITALIAYLLLALIRQAACGTHGLTRLAQLVRANLLHKKTIAELFEPPDPPNPQFSPQLSLSLCPEI
jgi:hypothetical protein